MKRFFSFLMSVSFVFCMLFGAGCGGTVEASFKEPPPEKVVLGDMIDFTLYLEYEEGASVKVLCSVSGEEAVETGSMFFPTQRLGEHDFTFIFTSGKRESELTCVIDVVAPAPDVEESQSAIFCTPGETKSFDELFEQSGIIAIPADGVNVAFRSVDYTEDYHTENISVEDREEKATVSTAISETDKSYTFDKIGKYVFHVQIYNTEGSVDTTIQVSVTQESAFVVPQGLKAERALFSEDGKTVQLLRAADSSNLSYVTFDSEYGLAPGEYYSIKTEFKGKNAPQLLFFADAQNGNALFGTGYFASLEYGSTKALGIYGPNRLSSASVASRETFGYDTLKEDKIYRWIFIFGVSKDEANNLVMSELYELDGDTAKKKATFNWASFSAGTNNSGYIAFMGSFYDDIVFRFYEPEPYSVG